MTRSEEHLVAIIKSFDATLNAGNLDGALTFLTDDILYILESPALSEADPAHLPIVARGKQQIRDAIKSLITNLNLETWYYRVVENRVTGKFRNSSDFYSRLGLDYVDGIFEAVFRGDKMEFFKITYSPESVQKMWDALEE